MYHTKYFHWRFILNVEKRKVNSVSEIISNKLLGSKIILMEPYWKIEKRYVLEIEQNLASCISNITPDSLIQLIGNLSLSWAINLSLDNQKRCWPTSGVSDKGIIVDGVEWCGFDLYNKE